MQQEILALGLMSGTSGDGVDAILLGLASLTQPCLPRLLGSAALPFPPALTATLQRPAELSVQQLAELHQVTLPGAYAAAVQQIDGWQRAQICGMHGQTIWHQPPPHPLPCTYQIGNPAVLAQHLGLPVVGDLRTADMLLGGQGAPISPVAHWFFGRALAPAIDASLLVVNLGGICNLTYVTPELQDVLGYDVGPGMVLSDAFARLSSAGRLDCDRHGQLSAGGRRIDALMGEIAAHPFLQRRPPKSTGKEDFGSHYFAPLLARYAAQATAADIAFSLLAATLEALAAAVARDPNMPAAPRTLLLTGGGAKNPTLVGEARRLFPQSQVTVHADGVFAPAHHEPAAMALIAARTQAGLPSAIAGVTGARAAAVLGQVVWPMPRLAAGALRPPA